MVQGTFLVYRIQSVSGSNNFYFIASQGVDSQFDPNQDIINIPYVALGSGGSILIDQVNVARTISFTTELSFASDQIYTSASAAETALNTVLSDKSSGFSISHGSWANGVYTADSPNTELGIINGTTLFGMITSAKLTKNDVNSALFSCNLNIGDVVY